MARLHRQDYTSILRRLMRSGESIERHSTSDLPGSDSLSIACTTCAWPLSLQATSLHISCDFILNAWRAAYNLILESGTIRVSRGDHPGPRYPSGLFLSTTHMSKITGGSSECIPPISGNVNVDMESLASTQWCLPPIGPIQLWILLASTPFTSWMVNRH